MLSRMETGVLVLPSHPVFVRNNDVEHPYRPSSDFFYLTGCDEPECVMVLTHNHKEHRFVIFVRPRDPERETWDGPRLGVEDAKTVLGADAAYPISELATRLPGYLEGADVLHHTWGAWPHFDHKLSDALQHVRKRDKKFRVLGPSITWDLTKTLYELRLHKDALDRKCMDHAILATRDGHLAAMKASIPGAHEYTVEAEILHSFRKRGCERSAYEAIVGSGVNATILHYRAGDRVIQDGDLVLVDAGAEYRNTASDVTRTYPANGKFSEAQRQVYDWVLRAQEVAIAECVVGRSIEEVHQAALRILIEGMIALGWLSETVEQALASESYKRFYMHGTSHWLGMDVHDVGTYHITTTADSSRGPVAVEARRLAQGHVLTVEPGIYVRANDDKVHERYRGIGIRIEDDILVTEHGPENLTQAIPKTVEAIEAWIAESRKPHIGER